MLQTIKNFLKKFIPPPTNVFNREISRILNISAKQHKNLETLLKKADKNNTKQIHSLFDLVKQTDEKHAQQVVALSDLIKQTDEKHAQQVAALSDLVKQTDEKHEKQVTSLSDLVKQIDEKHAQQVAALSDLVKQADEKHEKQVTSLSDLVKQIDAKHEQQVALLSDLVKQTNEKNVQQVVALSGLVKQTDEKHEKQVTSLSDLVKQTDAKHEEQVALLSDLVKQTNEINAKKIQDVAKQLDELRKENNAYKLKLTNIEDMIRRLQGNVRNCERYASEIVWAEIFNNVITDSFWLKNTAFSAGRWAIGYQYLYVMYRVLNEIRPQHILELGLGQSTRMISQYVSSHEQVEHFVVEHDPEWIDFFRRDFVLSERSKIIKLDREMVPFKGAESVRVFKGFEEQFGGRKFDFISIDAPLGGDMKQYARIDVLKLLPGCLADGFIIMIDDTERSGETNTVNAMKDQLKQSGIAFAVGRYSGTKDCTVICSNDLKFVCSM